MLTAKRKQKITLMGTCSTKANNFAWDFGNGTKGQGDTVQVSYLFKGTYDVQLIVYSRSGKSNGIIQKIVIQ